MTYEFTRQKIAADRKALAKRIGVTFLAGLAGFGFGALVNDMHSMTGAFATSVIATAAGVVGFYFSG